MTEAQGYVTWLSKLLAEYGSDPKKCEAIMQRDTQNDGGLLTLLLEWYRTDHPERVKTTTTERGTLESADCRDLVYKQWGLKGDDQATS